MPCFFPHVSNSQQTNDGGAESDCAATVFAIKSVCGTMCFGAVHLVGGGTPLSEFAERGAVGYLLLSEIPLHVALRVPASAAASDEVVAELASRHIQLAVVLRFGAGGLIDTCLEFLEPLNDLVVWPQRRHPLTQAPL